MAKTITNAILKIENKRWEETKPHNPMLLTIKYPPYIYINTTHKAGTINLLGRKRKKKKKETGKM